MKRYPERGAAGYVELAESYSQSLRADGPPSLRAPEFVVKDSGERISYESGMVRDTQEGKTIWTLIRRGPMLRRWAEHLTRGAEKYGKNNWTLACTEEELERFKESAARHFEQWLNGERDEDHAAAVFFNLNASEYVAACLDGGF